jgi:peptidoglycan hydrolase-like amidase
VFRQAIKLVVCALLTSQGVSAQSVQIGVLGLFRPHQLELRAAPGAAIIVRAGESTFVLEPGSDRDAAWIRVSGSAMLLEIGERAVPASEILATSRSGGPASFVLAIPGKISRRYLGALDVRLISGVLVPVVTMDLEIAVASTVQAESMPRTPLEALKAQAVTARSYFVAGKGRHGNFDFCDTTHCQFLRDPPSATSLASAATRATRGLVLAYHDQPFAAMFTPSCGGRSRTPEELGMPTRGYPYFAVICNYCRRSPIRWRRQIPQRDAAGLNANNELSRLAIDRRLGWSAVPSNNFTYHIEGQDVILEGTGEGHGIGLCQRGARAMAEASADFRQILIHYYPNTTVVTAIHLH